MTLVTPVFENSLTRAGKLFFHFKNMIMLLYYLENRVVYVSSVTANAVTQPSELSHSALGSDRVTATNAVSFKH